MRFLISRTSQWKDENPPCEGAKRAMVEVWDRRTFKTPKEFDRSLGRQVKWTERGTDHGYWKRGDECGIRRRLEDREDWIVELKSLSDLIAFAAEHGSLVLSAGAGMPSLEIYDDYRE